MSKTILLARPHPFIVKEMKPFLEQSGYSPRKFESLTALPTNVDGLSGAIISLAVESSVNEPVETVFAELRRHSPKLPVLFAAMLDLSAMKGVLRRLAKSQEFEATILGMEAANMDHPDLGKPNTLLYLCNADLNTPEKRALASKILQRHFR